MASQAMDLDQVGEHQNLPDVSFETQQQLEARQAMIDHPLRDNDHEGSSAKLPAPPPFRQPLAWYSGQAVGQPTRQPLPRPNSPPTTVVPHRGDKHDQEGATARGAYLTPPGNTGVPIESEHQVNLRPVQAVDPNAKLVEQGSLSQEEQSKQSVAPTGKRRVRKLRKKRPAAPTAAQPEAPTHQTAMELDPHVSLNDSHQHHDTAQHAPFDPVPADGPHPDQHQGPCRAVRRDSSHVQLQKEMQAAAIDDGRYYQADQDLPNGFEPNEGLQGNGHQMAPPMHRQYFHPQPDQYGPPEPRFEHIEDMQPEECPSSDIFADAAQEFEHKIYRKQKAKSAKQQAERNAWQRDIQQEQQAKQTLQDRFDVLKQEKDSLAAAIEKQKLRIAGFDAMANKLKTFIGGLANDMGTLKRDASSHRQNCRDIGEESKEHKAVLDGLLQQLSGNAEKSSRLKNEAIKACHSARAELSTATMRASHFEEHLKEKSLLLVEEKSLRGNLQSQLDSAANYRDTTLRQLKSSEQSILDKIGELAASVSEAENGEAVSEQLGKALTAAQELKSQQTATVTDIALVKGIVERLSEGLNNRTDDTQHQADHESLLKTHIDQALKSLKSDLCQQQELVAQDATNREVISGLQKKLDDVNDRVAKTESTLTTARANEDKLKADNDSLQARVNTLQSQMTSTSEQDAANLSQLRDELNGKVTALQDMKSELNRKIDELGDLSAANEELQSKVNTLEVQVKESPNAATFEAEREKLKEKHRKELEVVNQDANEVIDAFRNKELSTATNDLKKMTHDRDQFSTKLADMSNDLEASKRQVEELRKKQVLNVSSMQEKIDSAEKLAADRKKDVDVLASNLQKAQRANDQADSLRDQLKAEKEALQKAVQEKDTLVEDVRHLRRERKEDEERLSRELQQSRTDREEMEKSLKEKVHAAEEGRTKSNKQMQDSTEKAISAERAKCDKQLQALQQSLQDSQADMKSRIEADEQFREELQKSWQSEEKNYHDKVKDLGDKIADAEKQRDETVADNERLREDLAKALRPVKLSAHAAPSAAVGVAGSNDPRLQNRNSQSQDQSILREATALSQDLTIKKAPDHAAKKNIRSTAMDGNVNLHGSASTHGPVVEESQLNQHLEFDFSHRWSESPSKEVTPQSQAVHGSVVDESQQYFSAFSHLQTESRQSENSRPSGQPRGPIVEESQQQSYTAFSQPQSEGHSRSDHFLGQNQQNIAFRNDIRSSATVAVYSTDQTRINAMPPQKHAADRGAIVEETQETVFPSSQHREQDYRSQYQGSPMSPNFNKQSSRYQEAENDTQFVPETQYEPDEQVRSAPFAKFNATASMRKGKEHEVVSEAFDNIPTRAGALRLQNIPPRFQKPVPPSNTATKMVRLGTSSSGLSSLSERGSLPSSSAAAPEMAMTRTSEHKTPEHRSWGEKSRPASGVPSVSSPAFVEQQAKSRTQYKYHTGGSGNKTGTHHHSNHKESRASAPKRKAQSQVIPGYEQERKKKQVNHSSQGDANGLSELVESQNRGMRAPSSTRNTPRASAQPSRMQTFAGASGSSTRQTRNSTRRMSKNDEINARFEHELNPAR